MVTQLILPTARPECRTQSADQSRRAQGALKYHEVAKHGEALDSFSDATPCAARRDEHDRRLRPRRLPLEAGPEHRNRLTAGENLFCEHRRASPPRQGLAELGQIAADRGPKAGLRENRRDRGRVAPQGGEYENSLLVRLGVRFLSHRCRAARCAVPPQKWEYPLAPLER